MKQQPLALLEMETVRETVALNLLAAPIAIDGFTMVEQGMRWRCASTNCAKPPAARPSGSCFWRAAGSCRPMPRVRNLDSEPVHGFWLPTSFGRFYPDFVCELTDGRVLVAEYKGEHLRHAPREIEEAQVGRLWAERSGGRALFAMLFKLSDGMDLRQQLDAALR